MTAHIAGVDPSLTGCGLAHITAEGLVQTWVKGTDPLPKTATPGEVSARLSEIVGWLFSRDLNLINANTVLAVVEGPAHGALYGQPHERAGLFWRILNGFCVRGVPVAVMNPTTAKAYIAGHGRADKADVRRAVAAAWPGQGLARIDDNQADAVALATAGVDWVGWPGPWLEGRRGAKSILSARWPDRATVRA